MSPPFSATSPQRALKTPSHGSHTHGGRLSSQEMRLREQRRPGCFSGVAESSSLLSCVWVLVVCGARWGWVFWEVWRGEDQMVNFPFLIRIRKTLRTLDCGSVDCFQSSLFSGRAASWVKQARRLGPTFKDGLPSGPVTASASVTLCPRCLTRSPAPGPALWLAACC